MIGWRCSLNTLTSKECSMLNVASPEAMSDLAPLLAVMAEMGMKLSLVIGCRIGLVDTLWHFGLVDTLWHYFGQ